MRTDDLVSPCALHVSSSLPLHGPAGAVSADLTALDSLAKALAPRIADLVFERVASRLRAAGVSLPANDAGHDDLDDATLEALGLERVVGR